jgi:hypothetical protein
VGRREVTSERESVVDQPLKGILETVGNTPLVELKSLFPGYASRVFAKVERFNPGGSIKDRPAMRLLLGKIRAGELVPGRSVVVESSSGNLVLALTRFPDVWLERRTPLGYGLSPQVRERATALAARYGSTLCEQHHMHALPVDVDVIYTTRWQTTGTSKPDPNWRAAFTPFRVHAGLWKSSPKALFMHDLPAHRGQEVTAEVLDGPSSIAFDQAENKMHSAMAVLEWCRS